MWTVNGILANLNDEYTTNTSNGILSVLTIRAVPINVGNDIIGIISIGCILTVPAFEVKSATLTIKGTDILLYIIIILIYQIGISPVEDLIISSSLNNFLNISWSLPSFYSNDIPQESDTTYHIQLVGDNILTATTTDTFYEFVNVSLCNTFNVSITASVSNYISNNKSNRNGSKLLLNDM